MYGKRKKTLTLKVFVVLLSLSMTTAAFSVNSESARIIPSGKVVMIKDGQVIGEFSNEAPLPEGVLLKCEGKCTIKLDDVYMVVEKDTVFSVQPMADRHEVFVQEGTVYYSLSESSRPLHLSTPAGDATTGDLSLDDTNVRGYVRVSGNKTEIGVIGGGTMIIETASGDMAITPGRQITMVAAVNQGGPSTAATEPGGLTRNQKIGIGAAAGAVVAAGAGAFALSSSGSGGSSGDDDGSPAAP